MGGDAEALRALCGGLRPLHGGVGVLGHRPLVDFRQGEERGTLVALTLGVTTCLRVDCWICCIRLTTQCSLLATAPEQSALTALCLSFSRAFEKAKKLLTQLDGGSLLSPAQYRSEVEKCFPID
eukprot:4372218-Pyramimonas_sp.AAC.1